MNLHDGVAANEDTDLNSFQGFFPFLLYPYSFDPVLSFLNCSFAVSRLVLPRSMRLEGVCMKSITNVMIIKVNVVSKQLNVFGNKSDTEMAVKIFLMSVFFLIGFCLFLKSHAYNFR